MEEWNHKKGDRDFSLCPWNFYKAAFGLSPTGTLEKQNAKFALLFIFEQFIWCNHVGFL